jgi:hypothetical protein
MADAGFNEAEARAPRMLPWKSADAQQHTAASMRPRRARLGCDGPQGIAQRQNRGFNEAEARAPRMQPPYKPLDTKAIQPRLRPVAGDDWRSLPVSERHRINHVKELHDSNNLSRFERVRGSARHVAARKHPAGTKLIQSRPLIFVGITGNLTGSCYMTVARRSIFENVLPMLSMASSILSAGPTSIRRT